MQEIAKIDIDKLRPIPYGFKRKSSAVICLIPL